MTAIVLGVTAIGYGLGSLYYILSTISYFVSIKDPGPKLNRNFVIYPLNHG